MASLGDVIRVAITGVDGVPVHSWTCVLHYRITALNTEGDLDDWAAAWLSDLDDTWPTGNQSPWSNRFRVNSQEFVNLSNPTEQTTGNFTVGGRTGNSSPPAQCALLVNYGTGLRGRSYRGRTFWPGPGELNYSGDEMDGATVNIMNNFSSGLRLLGDTEDNGALTIVSRTLSRPDLVFNNIVTSAATSPVIATLRNRTQRG